MKEISREMKEEVFGTMLLQDMEAIEQMAEGLKKKYPFLDVDVSFKHDAVETGKYFEKLMPDYKVINDDNGEDEDGDDDELYYL